MEQRRLNLNAPLLSVRRFSNTATTSDGAQTKKLENSRFNRRHTLPLYKPDASLDQVTEPVAVPFHWEQIPGKAKDDSLETLKLPEEASVTPGISRRTLMDAVKHHKDASVTQTNPRGRVLDLVKNHNETKPRYRSVSMSKIKAYSSDDRVNKSSFSGEVANEKAGLDSNDDDDVYSDALETLSPKDSISMNCSATGLSGFDVPPVKPPGTFSTDRQTRDFMMSRFLPAAKAMAMEPAHHASRKQPMAVESSRQITKVVHENRTPPPNKSQRFIIPHYDQDIEEKESEDECDGYENSGHLLSTKACGWFPRLCFKNSVGLLNPIPGLKLRTQVSMSSTIDVEKLSRATSSRSYSQTVKKHFKDAANKLKQDTGGQPPKLLEVENKLSCASNRFIYASDRQTMSRTSPFRRSAGTSPFRRAGCVSPRRNEVPQSSFRGREFPGNPKEAEDLRAKRLNLYKGNSKSQELSSYNGSRRGSRPASPVVEKTLYVDTIHKAGILFPDSRSSSFNEYVDSAKRDFKAPLKSREIKEAAAEEHSFQDAEGLNFLEGESKLEKKFFGSADADSASLSDKANMMNEQSKALVCISAASDGNVNSYDEQISIENDKGKVKNSIFQTPLPPILPRTPSESWLRRTLPSISSQNPLSHSYRGTSFQSKWQDPKMSSTDTKWETIVKSSYLRQDHVRYSEELIPHASEHSKS
ncbi:Polyadenylate-binding protein [Salix suchowensis]|nr:Polyadenylate-binding protein [Salix suchowensis]